MIKGIIFDLDGVYFKNGTENFIKNVSSGFDIDSELVINSYLKSEMILKYKRGEITSFEYWNWFFKELKINPSISEIINILIMGYEKNNNSIEVLNKLREKDIKMIACSNNFKERINFLDKRFNFLSDFDYTIFSYNYGILKPELYEEVIHKTGLMPHEILVLDDKLENISKARERGFIVLLFEDPEKLKEELEKLKIL